MVLTRKEAEKQKAASTSGDQRPVKPNPIVHEEPPESPAMPPIEQETSQGKSKKTSRASTSKTLRAQRITEAKEEIARRKLELAEARLEKIQAEETEDSDMSDAEQDTIAIETSRARIEKWMDAVDPLTGKNSPLEENEVQKIPTSTVPIPTHPAKKTEPAKFEVSELTNALLAAAQALTPKTAPAQVVRQLPTADLPAFNGAHTEWLNFKMAYEDLAPHGSPRENTARLRRALKGRAKEEVNSLLIVAAKPEDIMRALENRFGRPHTIAQLEYEKLENIQRPTDAAKDVCAFANKIQNTVAVLYALGEENYCHHPKILKGLVEKLTPALRYRWYDYRKKTDKKTNLDMFKNFIIEEAESCREFAPPENILSEDAPPPPRQRPIHRANATIEKKSYENKKPAACTMCELPSHPAYECNVFKNSDSNGRWELAKEKKLCFRCLGHKSFSHRCKTKSCNENGCIKTHHRMLHYEPKQTPPTEEKSETETVAHTTRRISSTYLKIVPVRLSGATGHIDTHALLDDGSTVTLVDAHIASKIGADGPADPLSIETVSGKEKDISSRRVTLQLRGYNSKTFDVRARTIDRLHLSSQTISKTDVINAAHLRDLDSCLSYEEAKPSLLIGQDNWQLLIAEEVRRGNENQPAASLTPLGWVLHGATTRSLGRQVHYVAHVTDQPAINSIEDQMKHFFSLESLCIQPKKTRADPDELALQQLKKNTVERGEGGYETSLLWKNDVALPNNYECALKRMIATERKIDREPTLQEKYERNIEALIEKGYAEEAPKQSTPGRTWYLPHFAVLHPAKPGKVRVVFDAAARYGGTSLNDRLLSGPDLLQSLPGVLMRFRQHPVAVAADIEEMFLRIGIKTEDRDALRFLWRNHRREGPPQEYRMKSVIFGAACSPCIALFVKNQNAEKHRKKYPEAAEAIIKHHYMDDYLQSFPTIEEAVQTAIDVRRIHREANFNLCKWASNRTEIIEATSTEQRPQLTRSDVTLADAKEEKVLGLTWRPETDTLGFNLNFARTSSDIINGQRTPTKREALTTVMSLFDPLGFASPITIQAKRLLQDTWRTGTDWDEPLHESLQERWHQWIIDLKKLEEVNLPRCHPQLTDAVDRQLHVFVDASESSYAAAAYWRVMSQDGSIHVSLAAAKAKVAPLKVTSIPRLELQAAVLGSRLGRTIVEEYQVTPNSKYYWSDSKTVLAWLRAGPRAFKPYVAHRVAEIEEETTVTQWHWVPSQQNVADDATRDVPPDFAATHRWFIGPAFLYQEEDAWPQEKASKIETNTGEEKVHAIVTPIANNSLSEALPKIERFSSWLRLIRTTARVLQFIDLVKTTKHQVNYKRTKHRPEKDPQWRQYTNSKKKATPTALRSTIPATPTFIELGADYTRRAEQLWIRNSQQQSFPAEITALHTNRPPPANSRLKPLAVYIDDTQTLRLKSRIAAAADVTTAQKEPSVIDGDHPFTKLYIAWVHRQLAHSSTEAVVNEVRQQHWVLRLRPTVKQIVSSCLPCRIRRARPAAPPTGDHPYNRLGHHQRPFTFVGLDYFGPLTITVGRRHEKRYVALFTCLTTRALHLEIAASLSSDSAVMALRRFIARRGCPAEIYSDNGTNMHGADKELREALQEESSKRTIRWRFICPSSPFMGGCWERLVKSVKTVLQRVLHERHPHEECLTTLLAEVEYIVNSRPLTHVSVDPADEEALTPNHFLIGGSARTPPSGTFTDTDLSGKATWRRAQRLADHFWARWVREYLPELQHRREPHGHGKPIAIGDIVLIADGNLPRNVWPRGVVTALHPGSDGVTRVVDVRTHSGVLRRPTKKIVVLPPTDVPAPETTTDTEASVRREICAGQRH